MRIDGPLAARCTTIKHDPSQGVGSRERNRLGCRAHVHESKQVLETSLSGIRCLLDGDVSREVSGESDMLGARLARRGEKRLAWEGAVHFHEIDAEHR